MKFSFFLFLLTASFIGCNKKDNNIHVESSTQYFNYTVNGIEHNYKSPVDSFRLIGIGSPLSFYGISADRIPFSFATSSALTFKKDGISKGSIQNLDAFLSPQVPDSSTQITPIKIQITEFGSVGQFISGNFSGLILGQSPTNITYNVTCSFRIKRTF